MHAEAARRLQRHPTLEQGKLHGRPEPSRLLLLCLKDTLGILETGTACLAEFIGLWPGQEWHNQCWLGTRYMWKALRKTTLMLCESDDASL